MKVNDGNRKQNNHSTADRFKLGAAITVLVLIMVAVILFSKKTDRETALNTFRNDLPAGCSQAFLISANGKKILLTDAVMGKIVEEAATSDSSFITVSTPNGGTWRLLLPDSTEVWLNAGSTLTYPVSFAGQKERRIQLSGEAYFEVFKDKSHPFTVISRGQLLEVQGTHFNISAYQEDRQVKTTLLEGSVTIAPLGYVGGHENLPMQNLAVTMKPGQQCVNDGGNLKVAIVDASYAVAWKEGHFLFYNESIESIMEKLARWYDVQVVYEDSLLKQETRNVNISRSVNISKVLNIIADTGNIRFKVEGKTVFVSRNQIR
ncbi:FecR family protein [Pedobacter antarcticus]|uniref:FecR family protein n=1 Tax=Pedobacter antarcticus TaxID=34086 RepID=UPI00293100FC|nr:FecR domain-containing protein [Pedobacter antarcticus]